MGIPVTLHRKGVGSAAPAEIGRIARGTIAWRNGDPEAVIVNLPLAAGSWLVVRILSAGNSGSGIVGVRHGEESDPDHRDGVLLAKRTFATSLELDYTLEIWAVYAPTAKTTCLYVLWNPDPSPANLVATATEHTGLAASSPLDQTALANGTGTAPDSGLTAQTTQAHELVLGAVGLFAASDWAFGAWTSPMQAGQSTGFPESEQAYSQLFEGWHVVSATGQYRAARSGDPNVEWAAICATLRGAA